VSDDLKHSPLAHFAPFFRKGRDVKDQEVPIKRMCVHITGMQTYTNAIKAKQHPLERVEDYFDTDGVPYAHYTIDPWGTIMQVAEESEKPWAQGWSAYGGYAGLREKLLHGELIISSWYSKTANHKLGQFNVPLQYVAPKETPNDQAISIENIQYGSQPKLTEAQYTSLHLLLLDCGQRHGLINGRGGPDDLRRLRKAGLLFGHEDVDPWGRGDKRLGGWDPGARRLVDPTFCWECLIECAAHVQCHCDCVIETPPKPAWIAEIEAKYQLDV
jgi:N-acetyl-anhydromuramyl-L-alanine amidase AmpD